MTIEMIEPEAEASTRVVTESGVEVRVMTDEPNLLTRDVNLSIFTRGSSANAALTPESARELGNALLIAADSLEHAHA